MARYVGLLTADARGKLGGVNFTRSIGGTTLRRHSTPRNSNTQAQQGSRYSFVKASNAWATLTVVEQIAWLTLANSLIWTNALAQNYVPTPRQVFMLCQCNLLACGLSMVTTAASALPTAPVITLVEQYINLPGDAGLYVASSGVGSSWYQQAYAASNAQLRSSRVQPNLYRNLGAIPCTDSFMNRVTEYFAAFGQNPNGYLSVAARLVDSATGFASPLIYAPLILS